MSFNYCLYARKSTESDEKQALSIDSQIKEMFAIAEREGLNVVDVKKESHSAKETGTRAVFNELIQDIRADKYQGIITWATDRLSRCAGDLGLLIDLMDQRKLCEIRTFGQTFTNTPNDKFLLMILGSQAKLENDNRAVNVKRGMRTKCEMGHRPCQTPLGYLNDPLHAKGMKVVSIDKDRAPYIKKMFEMFASGVSGRDILDWADEIGFKGRTGKPLALSTLYGLLTNTYYYGEFEYPVKSGNWYKVEHDSIIDKGLFNKVQEEFKRKYRYKYSNKTFNFTRVFKCADCGSGITADDKFKTLSDGSKKRYIYYLCSRASKRHCAEPPVNEVELQDKILKLIKTIDLNKVGLRKHYETEVNRFNQYSDNFGGVKQKISIRNHMKYIITSGTIEEKRALLNSIEGTLLIKDREIFLK